MATRPSTLYSNLDTHTSAQYPSPTHPDTVNRIVDADAKYAHSFSYTLGNGDTGWVSGDNDDVTALLKALTKLRNATGHARNEADLLDRINTVARDMDVRFTHQLAYFNN